MKTEQIKELLKKYQEGKATAKECLMVEAFIEKELLNTDWEIGAGEKATFGAQLKRRIMEGKDGAADQESEQQSRIKPIWKYISVAAAVAVIFLTLAVYFWKINSESQLNRFANDVAPGKNSAILTLANGQKINLDNSKTGEEFTMNGVKVKKADNGLLVFSVTTNETVDGGTNTLETPVGGQYQVNLPDGTQVWLNARSSLKFPGHFNGSNREVVLSGEAYFEVAKDKKHPFIVKGKAQSIEVLGTHFNVNDYENEPTAKTTLLEGSVKVSTATGETRIEPGQKAEVGKAGIQVTTVDTDLAIDWKNGEFRFKNEELSSILRKLSRWYGVTFINVLNGAKMPAFSGSVSRFDNISKVLNMLEETADIKFTIKGKTITVN